MKKIVIFLFMVTVVATFAAAQTKTTPSSKVEVYYFHGKMRCPTCLSIESNAIKTVDTYFKDQKAKGTVKMVVIDMDEDKNKDLVEKYQVSSSSLFVTRVSGGKSYPDDITNFAFSYSRNEPDKFIKGLKDKITELLTK